MRGLVSPGLALCLSCSPAVVGTGSALAERPLPAAIEVVAEARDDASLVETRRIDPVRPAAFYLEAPPSAARLCKLAFVGALYGAEPTDDSQPLSARDAPRVKAPSPRLFVVVEERPQLVRTVIDDGDVRIVAYLSRADLHSVVRKRARVSFDEESGFDTGPDGVWLRPGVIAPVGAGGALLEIAVEDDAYVGPAYVEADAVDDVYEPVESPPIDAPQSLRRATVFTVDGAAIFTTRSEGLRVDLLARDGDRARVRYVSSSLWVEGWVPRTALSPAGEGYGSGRGMRGRGASGRSLYLHAGDHLHAPDSGELVGVVTRERLRVRDEGPIAGGRQVSFAAAQWRVTLWVAQHDVDRGKVWETIFHERARITRPGDEEIAWPIEVQRDEAAACWRAALATGPQPALEIPLVWDRPDRAVVGHVPGLDHSLRTCIQQAFSELGEADGPLRLPQRYTLHLDPTPFPERPAVPSPLQPMK